MPYCRFCGKACAEDSVFCPHCGKKIDTVSNIKSDDGENFTKIENGEVYSAKETEASVRVKPGLTGWLALVGVGLVISLVTSFFSLYTYAEALKLEYDIPSLKGLVYLEFYSTVFFTVAYSYLLDLYFSKKRNFPTYYFRLLILVVLFYLTDFLAGTFIVAPSAEGQALIDAEIGKAFSRLFYSMVFLAVWGTYMKRSKQVKATFVN